MCPVFWKLGIQEQLSKMASSTEGWESALWMPIVGIVFLHIAAVVFWMYRSEHVLWRSKRFCLSHSQLLLLPASSCEITDQFPYLM